MTQAEIEARLAEIEGRLGKATHQTGIAAFQHHAPSDIRFLLDLLRNSDRRVQEAEAVALALQAELSELHEHYKTIRSRSNPQGK